MAIEFSALLQVPDLTLNPMRRGKAHEGPYDKAERHGWFECLQPFMYCVSDIIVYL